MIKDKVVIITGASSGIGEATAKRLAAAGAKVVLGARHEDQLAQVTKNIQANGGSAAYLKTDVTKPEDSQALVDYAKKQYGKVDTVFLNAGVMPSSPLVEGNIDAWNQAIDVNLKGVMYGLAAVLPVFKKQNGGQVITTSSVAGLKVYPGYAHYCATKFAVKAVMDTLRLETAQDHSNIRTTTIYPANVHSDLVNGIANKGIQEAEIANRKKHELTADEVAKAVEYVIDAPEGTELHDLSIGPTDQGW